VPYPKGYYTIAKAKQMEIPINVKISWAKEKQADIRLQNKGRWTELVRQCPAAKELEKFIVEHVDKY